MKSISFKLWGLMLSLTFIALLLIWFFQIVFLESFYISIHEKKLINEGNRLVKMITENQNEYDIQMKIEELLLKYNARIDLLTPSGSVYASTEHAPQMMGMEKGKVLQEVLKGNKVVSSFKETRQGNNVLMLGMPIVQSNKVQGALLMSVPVVSVNETVATLKEQLVLISIILIGISAVLSYGFSKYFTKPILEINKAAKTMAEGNLSITVPVYSEDELGMLAGTINHLSLELQKIEQLRKELIANVSHEFRTPLSLIKGYAETIRDVKNLSEEKRERQLNIVIEEADKLSDMIKDILDLSQMQSNYNTIEKSTFKIIGIIEAVINRLHYLIEEKQLKVETNYDPDMLLVGDEKRIEQVMFNLVNNAINHSKIGGTVVIRVKDQKEAAVIEIIDQGDGISKEDLPYIWDRFYKGKNGENSTHKGSGLGLAIVKSILEAHHADYGVESEKNQGSKFWFEVEKSAQNSAI